MLLDPILSAIYIYPVKSCRGISLNSTRLDKWGLKGDRHWMVVDGNGSFLTQRKLPNMALVETALDSDFLCLNAPNMPELRLSLSVELSNEVNVQVWQDHCQAVDQGNEAAEWFSNFLEVSCRLVRISNNFVRPVNPDYAAPNTQVNFADAFPLLMISEASLSELNSRLENPILMNRFRPNLVVSGCQPFSEDTWQTIQISDTIFSGVKACTRCTVTTIDQATASRSQEPLLTLATFRRVSEGIIFGQNLVHEGIGELQVGNTIKVLQKSS